MSKVLPSEERYSAQNTGLAVFGGITIAVAIGIAYLLTSEAGLPLGLVVIGLGLMAVIVLFSRVALVLGVDRLTVGLGPWEWDVLEIPYRDVESVEVIQAGPLRDSGYRVGMFWRLRQAIVVRTGDAVRINRKNNLPFVVTVENAGNAVLTISERLKVGSAGGEGSNGAGPTA